MAREVVINSDLSGEPGARTYTISWDNTRYEVDLTEEEAAPIVAIAKQGRPADEAKGGGGRSGRSLEGRVRGLPTPSDQS